MCSLHRSFKICFLCIHQLFRFLWQLFIICVTFFVSNNDPLCNVMTSFFLRCHSNYLSRFDIFWNKEQIAIWRMVILMSYICSFNESFYNFVISNLTLNYRIYFQMELSLDIYQYKYIFDFGKGRFQSLIIYFVLLI